MVFFSCDGCAEMVKKNQVDAHASRCRRCDSVSCVDCSVSFFGDDYRAHTSCISEAERYEGQLYKKSQKRNPQQEWMDIVETSVESAPGHLKSYMRTMAGLDNIPRKEKQFRNFTSNSLNLRGKNESIIGEIWNVLKAEREKRQAAKEKQLKEQTEKEEKVKAPKEAETTTKSEETSQVSEPTEMETNGDEADKIDPNTVQKAMKKALKKAPNRSMKLKELRKLLGEKLGLPKTAKKRLKKLLENAPESSKTTKIKVDGKMIMLV